MAAMAAGNTSQTTLLQITHVFMLYYTTQNHAKHTILILVRVFLRTWYISLHTLVPNSKD